MGPPWILSCHKLLNLANVSYGGQSPDAGKRWRKTLMQCRECWNYRGGRRWIDFHVRKEMDVAMLMVVKICAGQSVRQSLFNEVYPPVTFRWLYSDNTSFSTSRWRHLFSYVRIAYLEGDVNNNSLDKFFNTAAAYFQICRNRSETAIAPGVYRLTSEEPRLVDPRREYARSAISSLVHKLVISTQCCEYQFSGKRRAIKLK